MLREQNQGVLVGRLFFRSIVGTFLFLSLMYFFRISFRTNDFISDTGGISVYSSVFGTLYGIIVALVFVEVWSQYNKTSELMNKEALGLERLFGLTVYFRDSVLERKMKAAIYMYIDEITKDENFRMMGSGKRNFESGKLFREISGVIKNIKFDDDHDAIVFGEIVTHYNKLAEIRSERTVQSLTRLPMSLRSFLYASSLLTLANFAVIPFNNMYYGFLTSGTIALVIITIFQIINDLDNPFLGLWNLNMEPFLRAKKHMEEDY